jgi:hypothetical protein
MSTAATVAPRGAVPCAFRHARMLLRKFSDCFAGDPEQLGPVQRR